MGLTGSNVSYRQVPLKSSAFDIFVSITV